MSQILPDSAKLENALVKNKQAVFKIHMPSCPHCVAIYQPFERLALAHKKHLPFYSLNLEHFSNLKIDGVPTFMWYRQPDNIEYFVGEDGLKQLQDKLQNVQE